MGKNHVTQYVLINLFQPKPAKKLSNFKVLFLIVALKKYCKLRCVISHRMLKKLKVSSDIGLILIKVSTSRNKVKWVFLWIVLQLFFSNFLALLFMFVFWMTLGWVVIINCKRFRDFLEIFYFPKNLNLKSFNDS